MPLIAGVFIIYESQKQGVALAWLPTIGIIVRLRLTVQSGVLGLVRGYFDIFQGSPGEAARRVHE